MWESEIKELKKYNKQSMVPLIMMHTVWVVALIFGLFFILSGGTVTAVATAFIVAVIFLLVGVILQLDSAKTDKKIKSIEEQGNLPILLNDFKTGRQELKDFVRLGRTYIIGKRTGTIVSYGEVARVYQYIHKTNFVEDARTLKVDTTDGKSHTLCNLPLRGKADDEVVRIISYMLSVNSNIQVGYEK